MRVEKYRFPNILKKLYVVKQNSFDQTTTRGLLCRLTSYMFFKK